MTPSPTCHQDLGQTRDAPAQVDPLARPTGLAVALCLLEGSGTESVRGLAAAAGVSTGAAHSALAEFTTLGLAEDGRRRDPDLCWAVAARWSMRWYALGSGPGPGIPVSVQRLLRFGCDDVAAPGWAEVGDRVAQAYGARVAGEGPRKLYLPDQRALTWALRTWEPARDDRAATALLTVPPTKAATSGRVDLGNEFLAARPIVVALELAADGSPRSRDVLEEWPGGGGSRVPGERRVLKDVGGVLADIVDGLHDVIRQLEDLPYALVGGVAVLVHVQRHRVTQDTDSAVRAIKVDVQQRLQVVADVDLTRGSDALVVLRNGVPVDVLEAGHKPPPRDWGPQGGQGACGSLADRDSRRDDDRRRSPWTARTDPVALRAPGSASRDEDRLDR